MMDSLIQVIWTGLSAAWLAVVVLVAVIDVLLIGSWLFLFADLWNMFWFAWATFWFHAPQGKYPNRVPAVD